jgi:hypothetical protein
MKFRKSYTDKERFMKNFVQPYYVMFKINKQYYELLIENILKNYTSTSNNLNIVSTLFDDNIIVLEIIELEETSDAKPLTKPYQKLVYTGKCYLSV